MDFSFFKNLFSGKSESDEEVFDDVFEEETSPDDVEKDGGVKVEEKPEEILEEKTGENPDEIEEEMPEASVDENTDETVDEDTDESDASQPVEEQVIEKAEEEFELVTYTEIGKGKMQIFLDNGAALLPEIVERLIIYGQKHGSKRTDGRNPLNICGSRGAIILSTLQKMQDFVEFSVKSLVDHPERVRTCILREYNSFTVLVMCEHGDAGKVIGKGGKTIAAIRTLVSGAGLKTGLQLSMDLVD